MRLYADVALAVPQHDHFQYEIPQVYKDSAVIGSRVWVEMRNRRMVGTIVDISEHERFPNIKPLLEISASAPIVSSKSIQLARWIAEHYQCSLGIVIESILPTPFRKGKYFIKAKKAPKQKIFVDFSHERPKVLNSAQQAAFNVMTDMIDAGTPKPVLLHGVTGSGKTEIYMQIISHCLTQGRGAIVLVPEIALTPQMIERFESRYGAKVAVMHSRLSDGQKLQQWHKIAIGESLIAIGPRSAVFAPIEKLGVIIIDEEHEDSYKQEESPRYHAREVAKKRCELEEALLVLGSATPSIESYYQSQMKHILRLELPQRVEKRPMPQIEVIDMRRAGRLDSKSIFSKALEQAVRETLQKKQQVMLFLNRRGFSTHVYCPGCGHVVRCDSCRIAMSYHYDKGSFLCHQCNSRISAFKQCPACAKNNLYFFGVGTQKVEQETLKIFPGVRVARMDSDATTSKDSHSHILQKFKQGDIDILIGTQMIAKGHDFEGVGMIGVLNADTALFVPDFRSGERTFNIITQVSGRTGRGSSGGVVVVQTWTPEHYCIQTARDYDYKSYYDKEIEFRRELNMPPFSTLIQIIFSGTMEKQVIRKALEFKNTLMESHKDVKLDLLGPAPMLKASDKPGFKWHLFIKTLDPSSCGNVLEQMFKSFKKESVAIVVDVDPR